MRHFLVKTAMVLILIAVILVLNSSQMALFMAAGFAIVAIGLLFVARFRPGFLMFVDEDIIGGPETWTGE